MNGLQICSVTHPYEMKEVPYEVQECYLNLECLHTDINSLYKKIEIDSIQTKLKQISELEEIKAVEKRDRDNSICSNDEYEDLSYSICCLECKIWKIKHEIMLIQKKYNLIEWTPFEKPKTFPF